MKVFLFINKMFKIFRDNLKKENTLLFSLGQHLRS